KAGSNTAEKLNLEVKIFGPPSKYRFDAEKPLGYMAHPSRIRVRTTALGMTGLFFLRVFNFETDRICSWG
ncbi:MAG TPA: hypothetical protein VJ873_12675, partial [bacterium]|nr:hypothetical protein [bacterium]